MITIGPGVGNGHQITFSTYGEESVAVYVKKIAHIRVAIAHHELKGHRIETCPVCNAQPYPRAAREIPPSPRGGIASKSGWPERA